MRTTLARRLVAAAVVVACVACDRSSPRVAPPGTTLAEGGYFAAVAAGDSVVAGRTGPTPDRPHDEFAATTWELFTPATGARETLQLPTQPECTRSEYLGVFAIDARTVGFVRQCYGQSGPFSDSGDLVAYDLATHRVRLLVATVPLGATYARVGDDDYLASFDSSFCSHLARYRHGGVAPLGISLAEDGWPLDANGPPGEEQCVAYGLVTLPTVSARGVAFVASPSARGKRSTDRVHSDFWVYVVENGVAHPVAKSPGRPRAMTWGPDGGTLYLSVDGDDGGVYAISLEGRVTLVTSQVAADVVAADGALVVVEDDDDLAKRRLVVLPLAPRT
jgi:hypothetical protein